MGLLGIGEPAQSCATLSSTAARLDFDGRRKRGTAAHASGTTRPPSGYAGLVSREREGVKKKNERETLKFFKVPIPGSISSW